VRRRAGFFRRGLAALIESRRVAAERRVWIYLTSLSDARLAELGLSRSDLDHPCSSAKARTVQRHDHPIP
jgi:hypothetical protein